MEAIHLVPLPPDISNLLAVTIRDVIWFKDAVYSFFASSGVPKSVLSEVRRNKSKATIPQVRFVLDELKGEEGEIIARKMLTNMYYWNDLQTIPTERRDAAMQSLRALREAYKRFEAQEKYQMEQREKQMHQSRVERSQLSELDHRKLQGFRDEFDRIHGLTDPQDRGNRFQDLMNLIFNYYCEQSNGPFKRTGEQIDGLFYLEKHWWYVEIRWKVEKATAADLSVLRDRARAAFGGDTKALFMSFNGYSPDCLTSLSGRADERVILMDGYDLRCVLDCQIAFDVLIAEKQADIVQSRRPFVGVNDIIARRASA